jgi:hypothetical protein
VKRQTLVASILFVLCLTPFAAQAQTATPPADPGGYKLSGATVSAGEDPISSGITGIVDFKNGRGHLLEVAFQQEQAWVVWGPEFKLGKLTGTVAGSAGHFQGSPWVGPYLNMSLPVGKIAGQEVSVGTFQWPCLFIGVEPRNWRSGVNPEKLWIGYLASFNANIGPVGLTYTLLNFLDDPLNRIPGVSYTQRVNNNFSVTGSVSRNGNAKQYMYYVGVHWASTK